MRSNDDYRLFDDPDSSPEEIIESLINDIERDYGDEINWRKAKDVLEYIKDAVENGDDQNDIYETAMHQLQELDL